MNLDLPPQDLLSEIKDFIVKAAKECAEFEVIARTDWVASNECELLLHIHCRNKAKECMTKIPQYKLKLT